MSTEPQLSIIIPCRDDERALDQLLPTLGAVDRVERIVVAHDHDGSTVAAVCTKHGATCITLSEPRGLRLRAGAEQASAPYLWFLHADACPGKTAADAVVRCLAAGAIGGYFRFRFAGRRSWQKRLLESCIALRCRMGGIPYGDQALFATAAAYRQAGQHGPDALFEEVSLVRALRRLGNFRALSDTIDVDDRRWEQDGYFFRTVKNRVLALAHALGASPGWLSRRYL